MSPREVSPERVSGWRRAYHAVQIALWTVAAIVLLCVLCAAAFAMTVPELLTRQAWQEDKPG